MNARPLILCALVSLALPAYAEPEPMATVTVTARKEAAIRKLDKTVHDVSAMPRATHGSAQDVLQATPELSVSADGRIAVKGQSQVTVLVDGKPQAALNGEERAVALQTMSGADIASIEVITNPSAAHQANGGAIVNIVLKRQRKPGKRAQVRASAADHGLWNAGLSGDLTSKNLSVNGSLGWRRDGNRKIRRQESEWKHPVTGQAGHRLQASEVFVRRAVASAALGVDYALGDGASVSLSARHNRRASRPLLDTLNETRDSAYHRISQGPNEQSDNSASVSYSRQGGGTAFKALLQHSATRGLVDKTYRDEYTMPARDPAYGRSASRPLRRLNQACVDWSGTARSILAGQWGMGLDLQDEVNELHQYQAALDPVTRAETLDAATTNGYAVLTTVAAAYLTRQIRQGKWEALLGGRIDRTTLRVRPAGGSREGQAPPAAQWRSFSPSLHLGYALSDQVDLTLNYRRSRQKIDARDLNPFASYVDAHELSRGNPGLQPPRMASWEIGASAQRAGVSGSLQAFHRASHDVVFDARSIDGDGVLVTSKDNGGRARSAGLTASLEWTPGDKVRIGADGGVQRVSLDTPDLDRLVRQRATAGYLNVRASWRDGRDDLSLDAHVQSSGITPLGRHGATSSVNLTWKRQVSKSLGVTLGGSDVFDGARRSFRTDTGSWRQSGFEHVVGRRIQLGVVMAIE